MEVDYVFLGCMKIG